MRWMSPELIAPEQFGFKNSRPTKASDCYALGMVIYETVSGNLPFHKHTDLAIALKVLEGERPPRGPGFVEGLWTMLEQCWASQPNDRLRVENVQRCLEVLISSWSPPGADARTDTDSDDRESTSGSSGVSNEEISMAAIERSTITPSGSSHPTNHQHPGPLSEAINNMIDSYHRNTRPPHLPRDQLERMYLDIIYFSAPSYRYKSGLQSTLLRRIRKYLVLPSLTDITQYSSSVLVSNC